MIAELSTRGLAPRFDPTGQVDFPRVIGPGVTVGPANAELRQTKNTGEYDVAVRFNEAGFRDAPLRDAKPDDLYAVGDSYTMGWGVEEDQRYSNVLARLSGRRVRNLAAPTNLDGYARFLEYARERGAVPRHIILGICMENDLAEYGERAPEGASARDVSLGQAKEWLKRHSALYIAFTTAVHRSPAIERIGERVGIVTPIRIPPPDASTVTPTVERIASITSDYDATVLVIPSRALWVGSADERAGIRRIHDAVVSGLVARGIRVVDPVSVFEAGGQPLSYYFANDPHWNASGHAAAAALLSRTLAEK